MGLFRICERTIKAGFLTCSDFKAALEMPPIKKVETKEAIGSGCTLRLRKANNVVAWNEELKSTVGALYGSTANFLQTNTRYVKILDKQK